MNFPAFNCWYERITKYHVEQKSSEATVRMVTNAAWKAVRRVIVWDIIKPSAESRPVLTVRKKLFATERLALTFKASSTTIEYCLRR